MTNKLPERLILDRLSTPIGTALLVFDEEDRLRVLYWEESEARMRELVRRQYGAASLLTSGRGPARSKSALEAYFAGEITGLDGIPCGTAGTPFQQSVWTALRTIPVGETLSYGALAARLGMPKAVRAVGLANGSNPVSVVIPCHRVIGSDGTLTGYGGGLDRKRWLLNHEGAVFRENKRPSTRRVATPGTPTLFAID
jgi:methylated-DNA-[protein]-cysteine S-methyltransferase